MFEAACESNNFEFRYTMMGIIEKLFDPGFNTWPRCWGRFRWWLLTPNCYSIDASKTNHLKVNVKRIKFLERLRVVRLFLFVGTPKLKTYITVEDKEVLQNRWVYDQVIQVIPADRVLVTKNDAEGLPPLPRDYRMLDTATDPPYFRSYNTLQHLPEGMNFL